MRGLNSGCVDLIYLDPPFNSNRTYGAPVGSLAAGAIFKDMWTLDDIKDEEHGLLADQAPKAYRVIEAAYATAGRSMQAYLIFMAVRLREMKRVLRESGSIYLHCDDTAGAYLKLLMDSLFGVKNRLGDIVWNKQNGVKTKKGWGREADSIFSYSNNKGMHYFDQSNKNCRKSFSNLNLKMNYKNVDKDGRRYYVRRANGKDYTYYADEGRFIGNIWNDIPSKQSTSPLMKESTGYPTQKPLALLERIIKASSKEGDVIFDPFCGCATTLVAAQRLTRDWIGCDVSAMAVTLVNERIRETQPLFKAINPDENPSRTDTKDIPNYKNQGHLLYGQQEGVCTGCNIHFPYGGMSIDHKHPQSKGGTDELDNLQMLCMRCNSSKGNKTMAEWNAARKKLL